MFIFSAIHLHNFLVILINGIEANVLTVRTVLRTQLLITPELLDLLLQIFGITAFKQLAGLANPNQLRDTTNVCSQHRCAIHLGFHYGEWAVLIPLRRINGEPCLTDQFLQCLAFLEANVLDVLNTIYCLFQRASTGEDELHIRQFFTDLDERADTLLLREAVTMAQRSELDYLIYNDPLAYAELILNGEPEEYLRNVAGSHGLED